MAGGAIRTLYTDLKLRASEAVKGLKAYDKLWGTVAKSVDAAATSIERSADRAGAALARIAEGAANVRASVPRGAGMGAGSSAPRASKRPAADPLDAAIRRANISTAQQAGLAAGAVAIKDATAALTPFSTKADVAKAKIADLTAQVERNRREMLALKEQTLKAGDADGTLAARSRGLAVETAKTSGELTRAKRALSEVRGGLIDNIKAAGNLSASFGVLKVAAGQMLANVATRAVSGVSDALVGATKKAMDFEMGLVGISKVARGADDTAEGFDRIKAGIKATSKELGVLPTEVANLTAALAPVFSGKMEDGAVVDIVALSNEVTKVGVAWGVTGQQAGKSFADISRGLGTTTAETKSLFGGINELGNQIGTNAADVAEAVQRSAGVLKGANISGETGAALNATLIATGASAEVAATGVRTFIARLGAGDAATEKQLKAFEALGLSAKDVAKELTSGDAVRAEEQIKKVVAAIGGLNNEDKLPVLIEMFGSESIGSIGAAATATDLLAKSMEIMGDKTASATSVQKEFDRVSKTSASKVAALKANIEVLAIDLGEKLLPHVNKVVAFLTSPEGQDWGKQAVDGVVSAITSLIGVAQRFWPVLQTVGGILKTLVETLGGATVAMGLFAAKAALMGGPGGILAGIATGAAALTYGMLRLGHAIAKDLFGPPMEAADIFSAKIQATMSAALVAINGVLTKARDATKAQNDAQSKDNERKKKIIAAGFSDAESEAKAKQAGMEARKKALKGRTWVSDEEGADIKLQIEKAMVDERIRYADAAAAAADGPGAAAMKSEDRQGKEARFAYLDANRKALKPSEKREYDKLSKSLDKRKTTGSGGRTHKDTKMDQQLAAMSPELRGLLTQGGDEDRGGDLKVAGNALDRAVYGSATGGKPGRGGIDGMSSPGPGPNITNHYTNISTVVTMPIDARSTASIPDNIRSAANEGGVRLGAVIVTGAEKLIAARNSGGVMRGPG
jgi:TP901 family phage tail tape measure protein